MQAERDPMTVLQKIRDAMGNGADGDLWPEGMTLAQAVERLNNEVASAGQHEDCSGVVKTQEAALDDLDNAIESVVRSGLSERWQASLNEWATKYAEGMSGHALVADAVHKCRSAGVSEDEILETVTDSIDTYLWINSDDLFDAILPVLEKKWTQPLDKVGEAG